MLDRTVFGQNMQRHRHQEFIRFLNALERDIPTGKVVHAIMDNYAPPSTRFLAEHNQSTKPFIWRADPNAIIAARSGGFQTLESIH